MISRKQPALRKSLLIFLNMGLLAVLAPQSVSAQKKLNEDSIQKVIRGKGADTVRIDAMLYYANYLLLHSFDKDSTGMHWLQQARQLSEQKKYPDGIAQAYLITGNYHRSKNEWTKSIEAYSDLIMASSQLGSTEKRNTALLKAYNNLGNIYNINGDFASSLENRLKAVEIMETMPPNSNNMAIALINTASDYRQLAQHGKAKEYIQRITPIYDSIRDFLKVEYYYEYYNILLGNKETAKAEQVLNAIDSSIKRLNLTDYDKLDYGILASKLHGFYELNHTKNFTKALSWYNQALQNGLVLKNATEITSALYNIGAALHKLKRYPEAIVHLRRAYDSAHKKNLDNLTLKSADLLASIYQEVGDPAQGMYYARVALVLKDSIAAGEKLKQLNILEARYQNEKKGKEIAGLQQTNLEKEYTIRQKNWVITGSIAAAVMLLILSLVVYRYYKNKQQLSIKEKDLQQEKIHTLEKQQQVISLQSMINGQETERTRIARDLHDGLGGVFSTVKMHFSVLQHEVPQLAGNTVYRKSFELVDNASDELRKIAHNMMPEVLMKIGLIAALQDFCNTINAGKQLQISLQVYGMEKRLQASTEVMLYRIIQELVNNIIKHAQATEALLQFNRNDNRLVITVEDNGKGFDTQEAENSRSMGLRTIKSRVDYLNGKLSIDSRKGVGTTVMIDLLVNEL